MKRIKVFSGTDRVGAIGVGEDGRPSFRYDSRWLASPDAFPVSTNMPLGRDRFMAETVFPWIANLLPEEGQLTAVARGLGLSRMDSLAILERIGGDVAGALSFGSPVTQRTWRYVALTDFHDEPDPEQALHLHFRDLGIRPFLVGEDGVRLSLAGGQEKSVLAVLGPDGRTKPGLCGSGDQLAIPLDGAPSTVILKPDNPHHLEGTVENEAYCMSLATAVGLEAAEVGTLQARGRTALIVVRYDRAFTPDGHVRRLHQEDFAQVLGVFPERKYERGILPGPSLDDILGVGGKVWSTGPEMSSILSEPERLRIMDQVIFNILVANADAHAKNYALLLSGGNVRPAPLYDVSCVLPWGHIDQNFAQRIAGRKRRPGDIAPRHWEVIAHEAGLDKRELRTRVERMIDGILRKGPETASRVCEMPGVNPATVNLVRGMVQGNVRRILGRFRRTARSTSGSAADGRRPSDPPPFDSPTDPLRS